MDSLKRKFDFPGIRYVPENMTEDEVKKRLRTAYTDAKPSAAERAAFVFPTEVSKIIKTLVDAIRLPIESMSTYTENDILPHKGALLYGLPGTGKTAIALAVMHECSRTIDRKVSFFKVNGAQLIRGEATQNMEDLFLSAKLLFPSVIFIDEVDCVALERTPELTNVLSLLDLMDGLNADGQIFVLAATNKYHSIDKALLRPGRFDFRMELSLPSPKERLEWIQIFTRKWNVEAISLTRIAEKTIDYSVADLRALTREAALSSVRRRNATLQGLPKDWDLPLKLNGIVVLPEDLNVAYKEVGASCYY